MEERIFYVYGDYRNMGKTIFYIGKGKEDRFFKPFRKANIHWMRVVKKEKGYVRRIIKSRLTEKEAIDLEVKLIKKFKQTVVNLTDGGEGVSGFKHSDKTKALIKEKRKLQKISDSTRKKMSLQLMGNKRALGYKLTKEELTKRSIFMKGRKHALGFKHSAEAKKKISEASKLIWAKRRSL